MPDNTNNLEPSAHGHPVVTAPIAAPTDHAVYPPSNFANHSQSAPEATAAIKAEPSAAAHPLPHGYHNIQLQQGEAFLHPELRTLDTSAAAPVFAPASNMISAAPGMSHPNQALPMQGPPPVVAPAGPPPETGETADGRKAKRELSQSKRAAQNRAAQRAFRQRKEGYIKKLEQQVRDYTEMEGNFKALQTENYTLREYVTRLQARLLDTQGEYPPPPPGINLAPHPNPATQPPHGVSEAAQPAHPAPGPATSPLEVAAQAVAGLNRSEHLAARDSYAPVRNDDDARTAQEITRQLQAEGPADGLPPAPM